MARLSFLLRLNSDFPIYKGYCRALLPAQGRKQTHSSPRCHPVPRSGEARAAESPGLRDEDRGSVPGGILEMAVSHKGRRCGFIPVFAAEATERQRAQSFAAAFKELYFKSAAELRISNFPPLFILPPNAAIFLCCLKNNVGYRSWASCPFRALLPSNITRRIFGLAGIWQLPRAVRKARLQGPCWAEPPHHLRRRTLLVYVVPYKISQNALQRAPIRWGKDNSF